MKLSVCFFFFFQAEDGIRARTVTGVQTCALPISRRIPTTSAAVGPGTFSRRPRRGSSGSRSGRPSETLETAGRPAQMMTKDGRLRLYAVVAAVALLAG